MSQQTTNNPDKTIVQRRVAHEGDKSRQAVRDIRAGMGSRPDERTSVSGGFVTDILINHARLQKSIGLLLPPLFCAAAIVAQVNVDKIIVLIWMVIGLALGLGNFLLSKKYLQMEPEQRADNDWQIYFLGIQLLMGLTWAFMFGLVPHRNTVDGISIVVICGSFHGGHFLFAMFPATKIWSAAIGLAINCNRLDDIDDRARSGNHRHGWLSASCVTVDRQARRFDAQ